MGSKVPQANAYTPTKGLSKAISLQAQSAIRKLQFDDDDDVGNITNAYTSNGSSNRGITKQKTKVKHGDAVSNKYFTPTKNRGYIQINPQKRIFKQDKLPTNKTTSKIRQRHAQKVHIHNSKGGAFSITDLSMCEVHRGLKKFQLMLCRKPHCAIQKRKQKTNKQKQEDQWQYNAYISTKIGDVGVSKFDQSITQSEVVVKNNNSSDSEEELHNKIFKELYGDISKYN